MAYKIIDNHPNDSRFRYSKTPTVFQTLSTWEGNLPMVHMTDVGIDKDIAGTLDSNYYKGQGVRGGIERTAVCIAGNTINRKVENGGNGTGAQEELSYTLTSADRHAVCVGNGQLDQVKPTEKARTLNCMHDQQCVMENKTVRRLTPTECERLQGWPSGYSDVPLNGRPASDSARYKALGNGMAQPCPRWIIKRIVEVS